MTEASEALFDFPCRFPVKAMGTNTPDFAQHVETLISQHIIVDDEIDIQLSASKAQRYLSVTVTITAISRAQLDAIYQALTDDQRVLMAL